MIDSVQAGVIILTSKWILMIEIKWENKEVFKHGKVGRSFTSRSVLQHYLLPIPFIVMLWTYVSYDEVTQNFNYTLRNNKIYNFECLKFLYHYIDFRYSFWKIEVLKRKDYVFQCLVWMVSKYNFGHQFLSPSK